MNFDQIRDIVALSHVTSESVSVNFSDYDIQSKLSKMQSSVGAANS